MSRDLGLLDGLLEKMMKNNYKYILMLILLIFTAFLISESIISPALIQAKPSSNEYFPINI